MSAYDEIEKIIFQFGVEAATKGGQEACDRVEYGHRFHFEDADALRYLMENAITLSRSSMDRLKGNIDAVIEAGLRDGKPLREVTKDVQAVFENFKGWEAERIARTEIARATNAGAISGYREMGVGVAEVVANAGACTKCAALNGELYPTDQAMRVLPRHPNCYCFWIPRPDIQEPGKVKGWRGIGDISEAVVKGLGMDLTSSRVSMGKVHIRKAGYGNHISLEEAGMVVGNADRGWIETDEKDGKTVICLTMQLGEKWGLVPVKVSDDAGLIAKSGYEKPYSVFLNRARKAKVNYGF